MNRIVSFLAAVSFLLIVSVLTSDAQERLRRENSFFGLHFDFHAGPDCNEVGKNVDREMVESILDMAQPDYIQVDCKGHAGYSSYPTKVGNQVPGYVKDTLKIFREVTAERGVALYLHYSGVWDTRAMQLNPEWAVINADGNRDGQKASVFGPYVDELLIPQLRELALDYGVDGLWVDGECWATVRDYSDKAVLLFKEQTDINKIPKKPGDPYWFEWSQFHRQGFRDYLAHYVDTLHQAAPEFQVASNWAYSSFMPEKITVDVDFISGDFSATNSINTSRLEGRVMAHQGVPWDLMAWSFTWKGNAPGHNITKTPLQLMQEAASVLQLGGGFQIYLRQKRDGSIYDWTLELGKQVGAFCRERQAFCHKAESVPQVGLILSNQALYRVNQKLFGSWSGELNPFKGVLQSLLNSQTVVDIRTEDNLPEQLDEYPLLIYPEWKTIEPELKDMLLGYVKRGGSLLLIGPRTAALFEDELKVDLIGEPTLRDNGLEANNWIATVYSESQAVKLGAGAKAFGRYYDSWYKERPSETAASITPYGEGKLAAVYLELGENYRTRASSVSRDFLRSLVDELHPDPVVAVEGSRDVDVSLNRKDGKLQVHLANMTGPHDNDSVYVFDDLPAVGPLRVSVAVEKRPKRVTLQPQGKRLKYKYRDRRVELTLPRVELYDIIVIEE